MTRSRVGQLLRRAAHVFVAFAGALLAAPGASAFFIGNPYNTTVQEYFNDDTGHYFLAADSSDEQVLDSGAAGPGWHRTSYSFGAYIPSSGYPPVYRFYAPGPNSHFYTADPVDLAAVRAPGSGWIEEGVKFAAMVPTNGTCPASDPSPIHRLYNNREAHNDAAHRYVFDDTVRASMVANGWTDEGVVLCAHSATSQPSWVFALLPKDIRSAADCTNEAINRGSCIGMNALPASLPNRIVAWQPPNFVTRGPYWQAAYGNLTGAHDYDVLTAQDIGNESAVVAHSYVQMFPPEASGGIGSDVIGTHAISTDASAAPASVDVVFQFTAATPAAGQVDSRAFPWRYSHEDHLDLSFTLTPQTVRRADAQSQGYGRALIEFRDVTSSQSIDVSVLAYGTMTPADFVGVSDPSTGNVWVGTTFGNTMLFGTNLGSGFVPCDGTGACSPDVEHTFGIRLTVDDFRNIVTKARTVNPALSPDVTQYILVNYLVRNGIQGNAEVGAMLRNAKLSLFGY